MEREEKMKFVTMAWVLGGMTALGLGMLAEACASSTNAGGGTNCASLSACCPSVPSSDTQQCQNLVAAGDDSNCQSYLAEVQAANYCVGIGTSSSSGQYTSPGTSSSGYTSPGTSSSGYTSPGTSSSGYTSPGTSTSATSNSTAPASGTGTSCKDPHLHPGSGAVESTVRSAAWATPATAPASSGGLAASPRERRGRLSAVEVRVVGLVRQRRGHVVRLLGGERLRLGQVLLRQRDPTPEVDSGYDYVSKFSTVCSSSACASPQFTICEVDTECPSGGTCGLADSAGSQFGICQCSGNPC